MKVQVSTSGPQPSRLHRPRLFTVLLPKQHMSGGFDESFFIFFLVFPLKHLFCCCVMKGSLTSDSVGSVLEPEPEPGLSPGPGPPAGVTPTLGKIPILQAQHIPVRPVVELCPTQQGHAHTPLMSSRQHAQPMKRPFQCFLNFGLINTFII